MSSNAGINIIFLGTKGCYMLQLCNTDTRFQSWNIAVCTLSDWKALSGEHSAWLGDMGMLPACCR